MAFVLNRAARRDELMVLAERLWGCAALTFLVRYRFAVCVLITFGGYFTCNQMPADLASFADLGRTLLTGHFAAIYSSPSIQAGPLQLIMSYVLMLGSHAGRPGYIVVTAVNLAFVLAAMLACRASDEVAPRERRQLVVGVLTVLWVTQDGLWSGHPAEVGIAMLWLLGLRAVSESKSVRGVVMLGLAPGIAPWAVLALPGLLAVARFRRALILTLCSGGVTVAVYVPFVAAGQFNLFQHVWPITHTSVIGTLDPHLMSFDWRLRLIQAAVVLTGTAGIAVAVRRKSHVGPALALLATATLRILTDPLTFDYYWISVGVLTGAALCLGPYPRHRSVADPRLLVMPYLAWLCIAVEHKLLAAAIVLVLVCSFALWKPLSRRLGAGS